MCQAGRGQPSSRFYSLGGIKHVLMCKGEVAQLKSGMKVALERVSSFAATTGHLPVLLQHRGWAAGA